jgi:hypothetical protein
MKRDERQFKQSEKTKPEIELKDSDSWLVKTSQDLRIPPPVKQMVIVRVVNPPIRSSIPRLCRARPAS